MLTLLLLLAAEATVIDTPCEAQVIVNIARGGGSVMQGGAPVEHRSCPTFCEAADLTHDGVVGTDDYSLVSGTSMHDAALAALIQLYNGDTCREVDAGAE